MNSRDLIEKIIEIKGVTSIINIFCYVSVFFLILEPLGCEIFSWQLWTIILLFLFMQISGIIFMAQKMINEVEKMSEEELNELFS